jgi:hypothetical protein
MKRTLAEAFEQNRNRVIEVERLDPMHLTPAGVTADGEVPGGRLGFRDLRLPTERVHTAGFREV